MKRSFLPWLFIGIAVELFLTNGLSAETQYKQRITKGKPVQGPVRPTNTPIPKPTYPLFGSLEDLAKLADGVRARKGILNVSPMTAPILTPVPTPTLQPTALPGEPTPTPVPVEPTPTPVSLFAEGTPVPEVIVDNGPLVDIKLLKVSQDRSAEPATELSIGNEFAARLKQDALDDDRVLPNEYSALFESAIRALLESRWKDALTALREVRRERPRYLAAWVLEIGALVRNGEPEEAEKLATTFDSLFPEARGMSFVDRLRGR